MFVVHMGQFLSAIGDKVPNFVGIKFTSTSLDEGVEAVKANKGKYAVFLGADTVKKKKLNSNCTTLTHFFAVNVRRVCTRIRFGHRNFVEYLSHIGNRYFEQ